MTFGRSIITAAMAAAFTHLSADLGNWLTVAFVGWAAWQFTTDPLPAAMERGLEAFRRRYQR